VRITTIWTIPGMDLAERVRRTRDALNMALAARIPKRVKYWAFVQSYSSTLGPGDVVGEHSVTDAMKRLEGAPHS